MEIPVLSREGNVLSKINIESDVSSEEFNSGLVHEIATMQFAGLRSGNASTKTRGEVSGGGKNHTVKKEPVGRDRVPSELLNGEAGQLSSAQDQEIIFIRIQAKNF